MDRVTERIVEDRWANSREVKNQAVKLKRLGNEVAKVANANRNDLSIEDCDILAKAAAILRDYQRKVQHAAEITKRNEQVREREYACKRAEELSAIVERYFGGRTPEQIIDECRLLEAYGEAVFGYPQYFLGGLVADYQRTPTEHMIERLKRRAAEIIRDELMCGYSSRVSEAGFEAYKSARFEEAN